MKQILDKFSGHSSQYKKFRPTYPQELFDLLLAETKNRNICWDVATGNGQVANVLAKSFKHVYATDISENQIKAARTQPNIQYSIQRAENTNFQNDYFDLITVGQAAHWFDINAFNQEVNRVLKPDGTIALWGYKLFRINPEIDKIINNFYANTVGKYWDPERKHVDDGYESLKFDFYEMKEYNEFSIAVEWTFDYLMGYLNTWSGVQNFIKANNGENPVNHIKTKLSETWDTKSKLVRWPIFLKIGKAKKH